MQSNIRISKYQLFCLVFMHSLGSATLFALGIRAKQDAWLVVLTGLILGFGMVWIHTELQKRFPWKDLTEINKILLGKFLGGLLTVFFAMYFFWILSLNFNEFAELIAISTLDRTPIIYIQCVFGFVIVYLTCKDLEVIGRLSEILMPFVVVALITLYILITISGQLNLKELQPILANGIKPVLKEAYPTFSTFPYGEDVVFLMYYCYVNSKENIRKVAFSAIFALGILLIISNIIIVAVLGVDLSSNSTIPLLEVVKLINIGDTIQNIDAIAVLVIFIGGLFKAMLFFYGSVLGIYSLLKFNRIVLIIVMNILLIWFNLTAIPNFIFHRFAGLSFTNSYLHEIYTIYIPLLLVVISWLKNLNKQIK